MECVICLEDISCNDYCKFNCCNNSVHNTCLKSWVDKSIKNKNVAKCFICGQKNSAIENIITRHSCIATEILNNNNNNNYIIIDISANNLTHSQSQSHSYIEVTAFFILKLIYITLAISILFIGFLYLTL